MPRLLTFLLACTAALAAQPKMVKDINPGSGTSLAQRGPFVAIGSVVYFAATDASGTQLWRSDGSTAGTYVVKTGVFDPVGLTRSGSTLFFLGREPSTGVELWKTDGTPQGTALVKDAWAGSQGGGIAIHAETNGTLWFTADDRANNAPNQGLWRSDGTAAGTQLVKVLDPGRAAADIGDMIAYKGLVYFAAPTRAAGLELWRSDGTGAGTVLWREFNSGTRNGFTGGFAIAGDTLYLSPLVGTVRQIWKTDGTTAGTSMVHADNSQIVGAAGKWLLFHAQQTSTPFVLWSTDGTAAGTQKLADLYLWAVPVDIGQGRVLAFGRDLVNTSFGDELYASDGTKAGTYLVKDVRPGASGSRPSTSAHVARVGQGALVAFTADDGTAGVEVWVSDGTLQNTVLAADIVPGQGSSQPYCFTPSGDNVFFSATDGTHGVEPWVAALRFLGGTLVERYGAGCAGTSGVPDLDAEGVPKIGSATFALRLTRARPNAIVLLALSGQPLDAPIGGGCRLLVSLLPPFVLDGHLTDVQGDLRLPVGIPNAPALIGLQVYWQAWVIDPQGAFQRQIALSNGLRLLVGI